MKEPVWISEQAVLRIHDRSLARHGGATGVRDVNLLRSALARPLQHHTYAQTTDICELAAILTFGIVKNHPFVDGNKRTGFIAGVVFLQKNGSRFSATNEAVVQAVLALAAGEINEEQYAQFLRDTTTLATPAQSPQSGA